MPHNCLIDNLFELEMVNFPLLNDFFEWNGRISILKYASHFFGSLTGKALKKNKKLEGELTCLGEYHLA